MGRNISSWQLQEAKSRFSEFLNATLKDGPQIVTRRGVEEAVLVPIEEWRRVGGLLHPSDTLVMAIHGGGLVTDNPGSPHLLADRMRGTVYVGAAENDASFTADQAEILDKALEAAGVPHTIETYHAAHGFAVPDNAPYDAESAEHHWLALRRLFATALPG